MLVALTSPNIFNIFDNITFFSYVIKKNPNPSWKQSKFISHFFIIWIFQTFIWKHPRIKISSYENL